MNVWSRSIVLGSVLIALTNRRIPRPLYTAPYPESSWRLLLLPMTHRQSDCAGVPPFFRIFLCYQIHSSYAESRRQHSVIGSRRTATLNMPQHHRSCFESGFGFDKLGQSIANATKSGWISGSISSAPGVPLSPSSLAPFSHNDDRMVFPARMALLDCFGNVVQGDCFFRNENKVSTTGNTAIASDPTSMSSHHFADKYAVVRFSSRMQPVLAHPRRC